LRFQLTRPLQQVKIRLAAGSTLSHLPHPVSVFLPIVSHLNSPDREMGAAMLRFLGSPRTFCDGVSRRNFLQIGAFGAGLKLAVVRSVVSVDEHSDSLVLTGYPDRVNRVADHPSFGSVVSKLRSESAGPVPPFVSLRGMSRGTEPGYLGVAHRPFTPGGQGNSNLRLANGVTADRLDERKGLLDAFDDTRRDIDATGTMKGMDAYTERAIEMVTAGVVRTALDL